MLRGPPVSPAQGDSPVACTWMRTIYRRWQMRVSADNCLSPSTGRRARSTRISSPGGLHCRNAASCTIYTRPARSMPAQFLPTTTRSSWTDSLRRASKSRLTTTSSISSVGREHRALAHALENPLNQWPNSQGLQRPTQRGAGHASLRQPGGVWSKRSSAMCICTINIYRKRRWGISCSSMR